VHYFTEKYTISQFNQMIMIFELTLFNPATKEEEKKKSSK